MYLQICGMLHGLNVYCTNELSTFRKTIHENFIEEKILQFDYKKCILNRNIFINVYLTNSWGEKQSATEKGKRKEHYSRIIIIFFSFFVIMILLIFY